MELRQLRYFVAVADHQGFSRAAKHLHLAQQSLSQQIGALERDLGIRLFDRDTRGTRLTDAGRMFLPEARAVLARADEAAAVAQRAARGEIGRLSLVFLASTANYMLPPMVKALRERAPGIEFTTHNEQIDELVAGLRDGRFDVAFTRPPLVDDLATRTLATEPACAVLPSGHPLADRTELRLADLADEDWVLTPRESWPPWHAQYDRDFAAAGFIPRVVQRTCGAVNLLGLVAAGVGITRLALSASSIRRTGVVFIPLAGERAGTVVAWVPGRDGPARRRLLDIATDLAETTDLTHRG
ncbi:DNA-binding transcriptional LysR family regulator [Actinomadura pelletieri DSM 43383]|uniref:DNA-binding transcriptional LysR family regulator n=1 Tax=Actinomadura pelletieri DSM 43383 TaxID=1120940 RepID=A0A495R0V8_9ACTN|nr:LysR family transcriptional regulator [Actinomadura pelletieri]RKS79854.1 DNA-binding transcriptional LysR family regulator [Actinomadura pelletieri DSM 43383]